MSKIYLSYRRMDAVAYAGRLFDHLSRHFGPDSVFMDIGSIASGQDFAQVIESALNACDVVLVLIGKNWASCTDQDDHRRLDDPNDWVRIEVAAALRRNILVVPVLVDGARLPDPASLPEELRPLCRRHACELTDPRWAFDVGELVKDLEKVVRPPKRFKVPGVKDKRLLWLAGGTVAFLLLGMSLFWIVTSTPNTIPTSLLPKPAPQAFTGSEVQAGHLTYKLLKADLSRYSADSDGKPLKWALQCSIRITDVMGLSTMVESGNFRLLVDGVELPPQNQIGQWVNVKGTVDADALFIIPADVERVELIVGQSKDATAKIPIQTSLLPKSAPQASTGSEVQAGHLTYKLLKADLSRYSVGPDGKPLKWALRCSIRITDVMGLSTMVESGNFRLLVDGVELPPQNQIGQWVNVKGTVDADALFIIPADVERVELIVGQSKDATAKIPIQTSLLPKSAPQASTGSEVQAGHIAYKLLKADLSRYSVGSDGKPLKWALRCSIRITDVMGLSTMVESGNFRLLVDGVELPPQNQIGQWVNVKGTVDADALFIIPADVERVELIVGQSKDATAKIPIELRH